MPKLNVKYKKVKKKNNNIRKQSKNERSFFCFVLFISLISRPLFFGLTPWTVEMKQIELNYIITLSLSLIHLFSFFVNLFFNISVVWFDYIFYKQLTHLAKHKLSFLLFPLYKKQLRYTYTHTHTHSVHSFHSFTFLFLCISTCGNYSSHKNKTTNKTYAQQGPTK